MCGTIVSEGERAEMDDGSLRHMRSKSPQRLFSFFQVEADLRSGMPLEASYHDFR